MTTMYYAYPVGDPECTIPRMVKVAPREPRPVNDDEWVYYSTTENNRIIEMLTIQQMAAKGYWFSPSRNEWVKPKP